MIARARYFELERKLREATTVIAAQQERIRNFECKIGTIVDRVSSLEHEMRAVEETAANAWEEARANARKLE